MQIKGRVWYNKSTVYKNTPNKNECSVVEVNSVFLSLVILFFKIITYAIKEVLVDTVPQCAAILLMKGTQDVPYSRPHLQRYRKP